MNLAKIYDIVVREGMAADPRGAQAVQDTLKRNRRRFNALSAKDKEFGDKGSLSNPYEDSRILFGSPEQEVKTALVGIPSRPRYLSGKTSPAATPVSRSIKAKPGVAEGDTTSQPADRLLC